MFVKVSHPHICKNLRLCERLTIKNHLKKRLNVSLIIILGSKDVKPKLFDLKKNLVCTSKKIKIDNEVNRIFTMEFRFFFFCFFKFKIFLNEMMKFISLTFL